MVGDAVMPPWPRPVKGVALLGVDEVALFVSSFSFAARRLSSDHVRSSFWSMYRPLFSLRFMIMNSQWLTLRRSSKYSTDQWYLEHVSSGLLTQSLCASPFHEEDPRHQPVCDQNAYTGKVVVLERSPQALVEPTDSIVRVSRTLAIRYTVEEVSIVGPLLPHALHLGRTWLEVSKVLFTYPGLFEDGYLIAGKGRWCWVVGGQSTEYAFGCLARATVG